MSGNQRMDNGDIAQSTLKGKAMKSALAKALNDPTPHSKERASKSAAQKKK